MTARIGSASVSSASNDAARKPDAEQAREEFGTGLVAPTETRVARALPQSYQMQPSLLLDVRNVTRVVNGTALAAGDGAAIENESSVAIEAAEPAEILLFDLA